MPDILPPPILIPPQTLTYATPIDLAIPPGWTNPHTFTLDPAQRAAHLRLLLILLSAFRFLLLVGTVFLFAYALHFTLPFILLSIVILIALSTLATTRTLLRQRRAWPTYRLLIADQGLIAHSSIMPLTRIDAPDILAITPVWEGYKITLRSRRHLTLSKRLLEQPALAASLARLAPIAPGKGRVAATLSIASAWASSLLTIALFWIGMLTTRPNTVLLCLALSLLPMAYTLWRIHAIKGLLLRTRLAVAAYPLFLLFLLAHYALLRTFP